MDFDEISAGIEAAEERVEHINNIVAEADAKDGCIEVWKSHEGNDQLGYWSAVSIRYQPPEDHPPVTPMKIIKWAHEMGLTLLADTESYDGKSRVAKFALAEEMDL